MAPPGRSPALAQRVLVSLVRLCCLLSCSLSLPPLHPGAPQELWRWQRLRARGGSMGMIPSPGPGGQGRDIAAGHGLGLVCWEWAVWSLLRPGGPAGLGDEAASQQWLCRVLGACHPVHAQWEPRSLSPSPCMGQGLLSAPGRDSGKSPAHGAGHSSGMPRPMDSSLQVPSLVMLPQDHSLGSSTSLGRVCGANSPGWAW